MDVITACCSFMAGVFWDSAQSHSDCMEAANESFCTKLNRMVVIVFTMEVGWGKGGGFAFFLDVDKKKRNETNTGQAVSNYLRKFELQAGPKDPFF
eukprot:7375925-Karenia_brevis.AAC.1